MSAKTCIEPHTNFLRLHRCTTLIVPTVENDKFLKTGLRLCLKTVLFFKYFSPLSSVRASAVHVRRFNIVWTFPSNVLGPTTVYGRLIMIIFNLAVTFLFKEPYISLCRIVKTVLDYKYIHRYEITKAIDADQLWTWTQMDWIWT